jgi:hypothetical protein
MQCETRTRSSFRKFFRFVTERSFPQSSKLTDVHIGGHLFGPLIWNGRPHEGVLVSGWVRLRHFGGENDNCEKSRDHCANRRRHFASGGAKRSRDRKPTAGSWRRGWQFRNAWTEPSEGNSVTSRDQTSQENVHVGKGHPSQRYPER